MFILVFSKNLLSPIVIMEKFSKKFKSFDKLSNLSQNKLNQRCTFVYRMTILTMILIFLCWMSVFPWIGDEDKFIVSTYVNKYYFNSYPIIRICLDYVAYLIYYHIAISMTLVGWIITYMTYHLQFQLLVLNDHLEKLSSYSKRVNMKHEFEVHNLQLYVKNQLKLITKHYDAIKR